MLRLFLRKLAAIVVTLFGLTILVFSLSHATGDPRYLYMTQYTRTTSEAWEAQGKAMGLDKPLVVQYVIWVGKAVRWGLRHFGLLPAQLAGDDTRGTACHHTAIGRLISVCHDAWHASGRVVRSEAEFRLGLHRAKFRLAGAVGAAFLDCDCTGLDI